MAYQKEELQGKFEDEEEELTGAPQRAPDEDIIRNSRGKVTLSNKFDPKKFSVKIKAFMLKAQDHMGQVIDVMFKAGEPKSDPGKPNEAAWPFTHQEKANNVAIIPEVRSAVLEIIKVAQENKLPFSEVMEYAINLAQEEEKKKTSFVEQIKKEAENAENLLPNKKH